MKKAILLLFILSICCFSLVAQNSERFKNEIDKFSKEASSVDQKKLVLFTGSSSVRMWKDLSERFPKENIVNLGFGGSAMSDLLYYADEVIFKYTPKKIFIYEGDNDVNAGKTPDEILADAKTLLSQIREKLPRSVKVHFISAKPSVARWHLKEQYEAFNSQLKAWTEENPNVEYIDVWTPMLMQDGVVMQDIFLADNLHMTSKGYDIWAEVMGGYLKK